MSIIVVVFAVVVIDCNAPIQPTKAYVEEIFTKKHRDLFEIMIK